VAGSLPILFADYDISTPTTFLATVEDHGTMEFHLFFAQPAYRSRTRDEAITAATP
jgi:hypothetical protein